MIVNGSLLAKRRIDCVSPGFQLRHDTTLAKHVVRSWYRAKLLPVNDRVMDDRNSKLRISKKSGTRETGVNFWKSLIDLFLLLWISLIVDLYWSQYELSAVYPKKTNYYSINFINNRFMDDRNSKLRILKIWIFYL